MVLIIDLLVHSRSDQLDTEQLEARAGPSDNHDYAISEKERDITHCMTALAQMERHSHLAGRFQ